MQVVLVVLAPLGSLFFVLLPVIEWHHRENVQRGRVNQADCGIHEEVFHDPSAVDIEGWQDTTFTYRYHHRTEAWIDANVVSVYSESDAVDSVQEVIEARGGMPEESGHRPVWTSQEIPTATRITTFAVYREGKTDAYELIVTCSSN